MRAGIGRYQVERVSWREESLTCWPRERITYGSLVSISRMARFVPRTTLTFINPTNSTIPACKMVSSFHYLLLLFFFHVYVISSNMSWVTSDESRLHRWTISPGIRRRNLLWLLVQLSFCRTCAQILSSPSCYEKHAQFESLSPVSHRVFYFHER